MTKEVSFGAFWANEVMMVRIKASMLSKSVLVKT